jgi:hypothetical protein
MARLPLSLVIVALLSGCTATIKVANIGSDGTVSYTTVEVPTEMSEVDLQVPRAPPSGTTQEVQLDSAFRALQWRCLAREVQLEKNVSGDLWASRLLTSVGLLSGVSSLTLTAVEGGSPQAQSNRKWVAAGLTALATAINTFLVAYQYDRRIDGNRVATANTRQAREAATAGWASADNQGKTKLLQQMAELCGAPAYLESQFPNPKGQ